MRNCMLRKNRNASTVFIAAVFAIIASVQQLSRLTECLSGFGGCGLCVPLLSVDFLVDNFISDLEVDCTDGRMSSDDNEEIDDDSELIFI